MNTLPINIKNTLKTFSLLLIAVLFHQCGSWDGSERNGSFNLNQKGIPSTFKDLIAEIKFDSLGNIRPEIDYEVIDSNLLRVSLFFDLKEAIQQDDWKVTITPAFTPDFHWSPHLTPTDYHIVPQHIFRAPALIMTNSNENKRIVMMPDINLIEENGPRWYMDLDALKEQMIVGWSKAKVKEHVLYVKENGETYEPGKYNFGFYIKVTDEERYIENPWRDVLSFNWDNYGKKLFESGEPLESNDLEPYVKHTYDWAFNTWKDEVWQEFKLNGKQVGAPTFIVNVTQSPNYHKQVYEREFRSIWNQAWFSSLRSASGLYRYAQRTTDKSLLEKAKMTKELALLFPQKEGFFPGLIATEMENFELDGKSYNRSKGWGTYYFGNSNRNPYTGDARKAPYHILDMSWTAYLMLTWYDELEKDERLLNYATSYADALLKKQDNEGFFPGWLDLDSLKPLDYLKRSPETSMSVTFLLKLYDLTKDKKYLDPALEAMQAVIDNIVPTGRWEDFETYWSCSRYGSDTLVNKKVTRNDMYKQNNFSMYWTAQALFNCYKITDDKKYIDYGQRTLDEMLMTQATWQPPYMYVNTLGGFGVMNADGEWNDSRQSLFSELILRYGRELNNEEYVQRGLAALRASFVMMYCPENPKTKLQWERKWNFFGKEDYGFMMENYGHGGVTDDKGIGIGEFTIYDWGNGAASEAYNRILDHFGEEYMFKN